MLVGSVRFEVVPVFKYKTQVNFNNWNAGSDVWLYNEEDFKFNNCIQ